MAQSKTLDLIRNRPYVAFVDDEREIGNSIIVTLKKGYEFSDSPKCGVKGFDTLSEAKYETRLSAVKAA